MYRKVVIWDKKTCPFYIFIRSPLLNFERVCRDYKGIPLHFNDLIEIYFPQ